MVEKVDYMKVIATTGGPVPPTLPPGFELSAPNSVQADNGGLRDSGGKPRYDLIPPEAIEALAIHYMQGAKKYADRNWERGMKWGEMYRALMSHAYKWQKGEIFDTDPKMPEYLAHHMIAVAWNAIALYTYYIRGLGVNDVQVQKPFFQNLYQGMGMAPLKDEVKNEIN